MRLKPKGYNRNISKLISFIFRNRTMFWDIPKWNRGQTKWDGESIICYIIVSLIIKLLIVV